MAARGNGSGVTGDQIQEGTITAANLSAGLLEDVLLAVNNLNDVQSAAVANNNLFVDSFAAPMPTANAFVLDTTYLGAFVNLSNAGTPFTVEIPSGTVGYLTLYNEDSVDGTVSGTSGDIDGNATYTLTGHASITLYSDGANYHTIAFGPSAPLTGTVIQISGTLSSADLLALRITPVTLIAGVTGFGIVPISVCLEYVYGTTPYVLGMDSEFGFQIPGGASFSGQIACAGMCDQANNVFSSVANLFMTNLPLPQTYLFANSAFDLNLAGTALTVGDGTLNYWVNYMLIAQI